MSADKEERLLEVMDVIAKQLVEINNTLKTRVI